MTDQLSLKLFHGRTHPDEQLDDWGFDGPCLGPLSGIHLTYGNMAVFDSEDERIEIPTVDDLLFYAGSYFGDARINTVYAEPPDARVDDRLTHVPDAMRRLERKPILVPRERRRAYSERVSVFVDSIRELVGDRAAAATGEALLRVVTVK